MRHRKSRQEKEAKRRLRSVTPDNCGKVVARSCYWTVDFLLLYLDACDDRAFDVPQDGYALAVQAPELARRIEVGPEPGQFASNLERASSRVLSYAVFGSCCRAAGRLSEAEAALGLASDLAQGQEIEIEAQAELTRRSAVLLLQQDHPEANVQIERAVELSRRASYRAGLADALQLRGLARIYGGAKAGASDLVEAMCHADLKTERGRRNFSGAVQNLCFAATQQAVTLQEQEQAYKMLQTVKEMMARQPKSVRKMKVYWTEGLLLHNLGVSRHAARRLIKARQGFRELGQYADFALASFDLAAVYRDDADSRALDELVAETCRIVAEESGEPRLLEMLRPWRREPAAGG
ncbi:MAG: hypothetical protein AAF725_07570, partial [Acidobacteriota bacterium]